MIKFKTFSVKNLFPIMAVLLLSGLALGQNLRQDLNKSFKKFNITRLDQARSGSSANDSSLNISTTEKNYVLEIRPRDLRASQYRAEAETENGRQAVYSDGVKTFRGKIAGKTDSEVRLLIDGEKIEGYFFDNADRYFIEPAKRYSKLAGDDDLVVYREEDFINPEGFTCNSELFEKIERTGKFVQSKTENATTSGLRVIEIATEADYEFVTLMGGSSQANTEILATLNMVEGVYERELGLTFDVVYQRTWATPDQYNGANSDALLRSFMANWNANITNVSRDVAHLWTAKPNVLAQGYGFLNVICANPSFAYSLSGHVQWTPAKYDVTAHEIGHNLGANHADASQNCSNTVMNSVLSADTPLTFCSFSRTEITNFVSSNSSCLSQRISGATKFDFDGDNKSDSVVFRPSNGAWYVLRSGNGAFQGYLFGMNGDKPVPADYDGDGKTDAAVYRNGTWYRLKSSTGSFDGIAFGNSTDIPVPADFDGDGKIDVAVFRPSNGAWYILKSVDGGFVATNFGASDDIPLPGDFDGDGKADINVFRPSNGAWYRLNSSNNAFNGEQFGMLGDKPVAGDFDGDAKADLAVFRPSNGYWYILNSGSGSMFGMPFGFSTDVPVPADFNGDGKTDIGVFRNGVWHRFIISQNAYSGVQFGTNGDIPAQALYVQ